MIPLLQGRQYLSFHGFDTNGSERKDNTHASYQKIEAFFARDAEFHVEMMLILRMVMNLTTLHSDSSPVVISCLRIYSLLI
jgi:hypothetical protein